MLMVGINLFHSNPDLHNSWLASLNKLYIKYILNIFIYLLYILLLFFYSYFFIFFDRIFFYFVRKSGLARVF
jgi:hypothetical protein